MIDMRTVVFSYAISNAICTFVMALLWIRNRRHFAGLGFWLADFAMQFTAVLLAPLRGILPDFASIVMATTLAIAGAIFLLIGLERFAGKRASQLHNYILLAAFICVHAYFTFVQPSLLNRAINFSLAVFLVHAQGAWLMLRRVDIDLRPTTRGVGYLFLAVCLVAIARLIADLIADPGNDFFNSSIYDTLYILMNQMLFIILTFSLVLMVNRRTYDELERDIADREMIEKEELYRTNVLAALHQVTLDLVNRHETDDILHTLLVNIGVLLDASDIRFDLVETNDTLVTYEVASEQPLKKGDAMQRGEGGWLSWQAIESGQPVVLEDYSALPDRRPLYEGYPIHAIMIIPVRQRDRVIGAINISRSEADKPFNDSDVYVAGQLALMVALVLDNAQVYSQLQSKLTESVQREAALHEAQAQVIDQQRTMATVDERQRMARDLHDSVNQSIHSLVLFSETLVSTLDKNNVERARQISERLQERARQALKETRLLLYQTQASVKGRGVHLIEELNVRLANVELRAGVRAQIIQEGSLEHCPAAWHENLFWITIEALNNSLKHAQARSAQIIIRCFPDYVELEVVDNGKGFDITKPGAGGYGLRNMQERAGLLGGRLTFTSTPSKGTSVLFRTEIR